MTRLRDHLVQLIAAQGPLSIADFMATVLTAREHGYYMHGDPFGAGGDFTTAPEISQVFGELIGAWAVAVWEALGSPSRFSLVELGPGRGTLMRDALRAARVRPAFLAAADVVLVEISPSLRELQQRALVNASPRSLSWQERFGGMREQPLIVIANELFDALPIQQFVATKGGWRERRVGLDADQNLNFVLSPAMLPERLFPMPSVRCDDGVVFEFSAAREAVAANIGNDIAANHGAALIIDYGFAGPAVGDTLQAVKAHRYVPVFEDIGYADLTSHVDFTALATGLAAGGATVYGPITQSALIERLGGRERTAALAKQATAEQRAALDAGLRRLTDPAQMGSLFKAVAVASPGLQPPGFAAHERS